MKENDRIIWRYCGNKGYSEGIVKEINDKFIRIAESRFGIGSWFCIGEIEIEKLNEN